MFVVGFLRRPHHGGVRWLRFAPKRPGGSKRRLQSRWFGLRPAWPALVLALLSAQSDPGTVWPARPLFAGFLNRHPGAKGDPGRNAALKGREQRSCAGQLRLADSLAFVLLDTGAYFWRSTDRCLFRPVPGDPGRDPTIASRSQRFAALQRRHALTRPPRALARSWWPLATPRWAKKGTRGAGHGRSRLHVSCNLGWQALGMQSAFRLKADNADRHFSQGGHAAQR